MIKVILDAKNPAIDGNTRIALERAKKAASIDRSSTCFKGKGSLSKTSLAQCMRLAQKKKDEEYM